MALLLSVFTGTLGQTQDWSEMIDETVYWEADAEIDTHFEAYAGDRVMFVFGGREVAVDDVDVVASFAPHVCGAAVVWYRIAGTYLSGECKRTVTDLVRVEIRSLGKRTPVKSDMVMTAAVDRWRASSPGATRVNELSSSDTERLADSLRPLADEIELGEPWKIGGDLC